MHKITPKINVTPKYFGHALAGCKLCTWVFCGWRYCVDLALTHQRANEPTQHHGVAARFLHGDFVVAALTRRSALWLGLLAKTNPMSQTGSAEFCLCCRLRRMACCCACWELYQF